VAAQHPGTLWGAGDAAYGVNADVELEQAEALAQYGQGGRDKRTRVQGYTGYMSVMSVSQPKRVIVVTRVRRLRAQKLIKTQKIPFCQQIERSQ